MLSHEFADVFEPVTFPTLEFCQFLIHKALCSNHTCNTIICNIRHFIRYENMSQQYRITVKRDPAPLQICVHPPALEPVLIF